MIDDARLVSREKMDELRVKVEELLEWARALPEDDDDPELTLLQIFARATPEQRLQIAAFFEEQARLTRNRHN